jgi:hypothetical protein
MGELPRIPGVSESAAAEQARARQTDTAAGPAFEALLERLTNHAAELEQRSRSLARPEEVSGAVDAARASLEDALTLGEELLEAYRAAQSRGEGSR